MIHEEYNELLVPDLGADLVRRFDISEDQLFHDQQRLGHIQHEAGSGPRHVAYYGVS